MKKKTGSPLERETATASQRRNISEKFQLEKRTEPKARKAEPQNQTPFPLFSCCLCFVFRTTSQRLHTVYALLCSALTEGFVLLISSEGIRRSPAHTHDIYGLPAFQKPETFRGSSPAVSVSLALSSIGRDSKSLHAACRSWLDGFAEGNPGPNGTRWSDAAVVCRTHTRTTTLDRQTHAISDFSTQTTTNGRQGETEGGENASELVE